MEHATKEATPFTKEVVLKLINGTMTFDQAGALFNVDSSIFKARLQQLHFFARKMLDGSLLEIHGGGYHGVTIVLRYMRNNEQLASFYTLLPTVSLQNVMSLIEEEPSLASPGCYKLTFKHPNKSIGNVVVKTERDWHMVLSFSRSRGYYVYLDLEFFPSSETGNEVSYDEITWLMPLWDPSYEDAFDKENPDMDAFDEDSCDEDSRSRNVFVEDFYDESHCDEDSVEHITNEAVLLLNNGSMTFEEARAFFNVNSEIFEDRLVQLNIFLWKERDGSLVRIHGEDHETTIVIKTVKDKYYYTVHSTDSFESVISMIEKYLELSHGCYKLIFKHPKEKYGNVWVKTDRDWHFVVSISSFKGYLVNLDLEVFPSSQTTDACNEPIMMLKRD